MLAWVGGGRLEVEAWGPTTLLLGCASKSKLNLRQIKCLQLYFLREEHKKKYITMFLYCSIKHYLRGCILEHQSHSPLFTRNVQLSKLYFCFINTYYNGI